ncbi:MAG: hypothetical protein OXN81_02155 [Alphaproteobacteria bacterium]|nr:hypothetical protein [Alphaproteobacteria bacterium]
MAAFAAALLLPWAQYASADQPTVQELTQLCQEAWADSTASDYCTVRGSIEWIGSERTESYAGCEVGPNCTATVQIGGESATFDGSYGYVKTIDTMSSLTVCFLKYSSSAPYETYIRGWRMALRTCDQEGQVDIDTATSDGLPALED